MLFLIFKAGKNQYALETTCVLRVVPCVALRSCPGTPAYIAGLLNFRSRPVAVVDLGELINHVPCKRFLSTRIIVTEYTRPEGRRQMLGLMAEGVTAIMQKDRLDFLENVLNTPDIKYLGKMFRDGEQLVQLVKVEDIVSAELEKMLNTSA